MQGTYINNSTEQANTSGAPLAALVDASTLYTRQLPNHLFAMSYNGVFASSALATLQYSHKKDGRRNNGGRSTAIVDSPFVTAGRDGRRARVSLLSRAILRCDRPGGSEQPAAHRQSVVPALIRPVRQSRPEGWRGVLRQHGDRRQLAVVRPATCSTPTTWCRTAGRCSTRAAGPSRASSPACRWCGTRWPRGAPESTSRRRRVYFEDRWTVTPRLTVSLGARFESVQQRRHRRHHDRRHHIVRASPGCGLRRPG